MIFCPQAEVKFSSSGVATVPGEGLCVVLSREEAWQMFLAKLDEEANYFSVTEEEPGKGICACRQCVVRTE